MKWTPPGKRKPGRPRTTWRRTIKTDIEELGYTWDRLSIWQKTGKRRKLVDGSCPSWDEKDWRWMNMLTKHILKFWLDKIDVNISAPNSSLTLWIFKIFMGQLFYILFTRLHTGVLLACLTLQYSISHLGSIPRLLFFIYIQNFVFRFDNSLTYVQHVPS